MDCGKAISWARVEGCLLFGSEKILILAWSCDWWKAKSRGEVMV